VIEFASETKRFRPGLVPADEAHRAAARAFVEKRVAGGGTALAGAIGEALAQAATATDAKDGGEGRLALVVLLTDGRPTVGERDGDAILRHAVGANAGGARVFTFGVGRDLDVRLLDRLAQKTGGVREYVGEHERLDAVVTAFFRTVDRPVLTDVTLTASEGVGSLYPKQSRDLFAGAEVVVLGRYEKPGPVELTLRGKRAGRDVTFVFRGTLSEHEDDAGLERIWAQRKVAYLLDHVRLHGENEELVDEIRALATRHAFVTPYTAHLVVEPGARRRITSSTPLHFDSSGRRGSGGGHGGAFRGPNGGVPPGLRDPSDPQPAPPPASDAGGRPPSGPTTPGMPSPPPVDASKALKEAKESDRAGARLWTRTVNGRLFRYTTRDRWVDAAWDGKREPIRIETFSEEFWDLLEAHPELAKVLALGKRVVFLHEGEVYEVAPPPKKDDEAKK